MARTTSNGLTYFPLNCDTDAKEEAIQAAFGNDGLAVYLTLWRLAYRTASGEVDLSEEYKVRAVAKKCNVSVAKFRKVLQLCLKENIFSLIDFSEKAVVTSNGIKKRIQKISSEREYAKLQKAKRIPQKPENSSANNSRTTVDSSANNVRTMPEIGNRKQETGKETIGEIGEGTSCPPAPDPKPKPEPSEAELKKGADAEARKNFKPPSAGEVLQHFREKAYGDPDRESIKFWNYYEQIDWRVGRNKIKMKDWRLSAHNWNLNNPHFTDTQSIMHANRNTKSSYQKRAEYNHAEHRAEFDELEKGFEAIDRTLNESGSGGA